jgi:ketosteroid isomerase-like protein
LKTAADALDLQFKDAFNRGDAEALAATYWNSPDMVSMAPDGMTVGMEATKASMSGMFAAMPGAHLELIEGRNDVHGDTVIGWGRWRMTIPGPTPTVMEGRYSDVKAMKDGRMVYIIDHASVPLPPPPAEIKK